MSSVHTKVKYCLVSSESGAWGDDPDGDAGVAVLRSTEIGLDGQVRLRDPAMRALSNREIRRTRLAAGDLLVVRSSGSDAHLGKTGFVDENSSGFSFSNFIQRLRFSVQYSPRFAWHFLNSTYAKEQIKNLSSTTTGLQNLSAALIGELEMPSPPLEEQRRTADFLDAATARIDTLRASRQAQIAALRERELAIIASMLSGGAMSGNGRPTGWQWLPYIPEEWSIGPVYAYFSTELGKMLNPDRASGANQRPYLRNANIHWYEIDTSDMAEMSFAADEIKRYSVSLGDLLVCEGGAGVAEAAVWDGRIAECYFQKSLHRVRRSSSVPVEWLMYWLRLAKSCGVFEAGGNIATIPHLTGEQLRQYRIPIPSDGDALVRTTGQAIAAMVKARVALNQAQALLAERREALITAAVTGQFDVSTASGRGIEE